MPRPNEVGQIESEAHLASRVAHEREKRGLSYEGLAKLLTEAGSPIQGSAIFRIEKGSPPRRITVNELIAFSRVFGVDTVDLMRPMELVNQERARELAAALPEVNRAFDAAIAEGLRVYYEYGKVAAESAELLEYLNNHMAVVWGEMRSLELDAATLSDLVTQEEADNLRRDSLELWGKVLRLASKAAGPMATAEESSDG